MPPSGTWVGTEELDRLERLSRAQLQAAESGDLEGLVTLLEARERTLDGLRGRRVPAGSLTDLVVRDMETRALLEARIRSVERALVHLREGARALRGYAMPAAEPPGFIDQFR